MIFPACPNLQDCCSAYEPRQINTLHSSCGEKLIWAGVCFFILVLYSFHLLAASQTCLASSHLRTFTPVILWAYNVRLSPGLTPLLASISTSQWGLLCSPVLEPLSLQTVVAFTHYVVTLLRSVLIVYLPFLSPARMQIPWRQELFCLFSSLCVPGYTIVPGIRSIW